MLAAFIYLLDPTANRLIVVTTSGTHLGRLSLPNEWKEEIVGVAALPVAPILGCHRLRGNAKACAHLQLVDHTFVLVGVYAAILLGVAFVER